MLHTVLGVRNTVGGKDRKPPCPRGTYQLMSIDQTIPQMNVKSQPTPLMVKVHGAVGAYHRAPNLASKN